MESYKELRDQSLSPLLEENNDHVSSLSFNSALNTVRAKLADSPVSLSFSAVERSRRPDGQGGCSISVLVLRSQSLKRGPHFTVTKCGDSNRHDFADEKIDKRRRNIKMEITALYSPAPVGQNFTQQLSVQNA